MVIWHHSATEKRCDVPGGVGIPKRLCHVDQLLHSKVTSIDSEPDPDDVPDLELTPTLVEPEVSNATPRSESEGTCKHAGGSASQHY